MSETEKKEQDQRQQEHRSVRSSRTRLSIILPALSVLLIASTGFIVMHVSMRVFLPPAGIPEGRILSAYQSVVFWILILVAIGFVVSLSLTLSVVRPLRRLEKTFEAISAGQLTPIKDFPGSSELDAVTEAFNEMVVSINQMLRHRLTGALMTCNSEGVVTSCNASAEVLLGVSAVEVVGKGYQYALGSFGQNTTVTNQIGQALRLKRSLKLEEIEFQTRDDRPIRANLDLWLTQEREQSEPTAVIVLRDVSELESLKDNFRPFQQFLALGSLSGYVTHEMKNPVNAIQGTAELLARHMDPADPRLRYLNNIQQASEKLVRLIDELRDLSSPGLEQSAECEANDILHQAVLYTQSAKTQKRVRFIEEYTHNLPRIHGDSNKLFQAFSNIIKNAVDAIPEEGVITVRSGLKQNGENPWIGIDIHNTGSYLDEERRKQIFQPFHTSKANGFGLGLWVCKKNIMSHSGKIFVESEPDKGTTFRIELPCMRTSQ